MHESFWCTTPCWAFGVGSVPNFSHANRCIVVSHYCFNLHYLDDIWCGESLHMLICHLFIFNEMSIQVFGTLFQIICFLIVEFLRLFCIFSVTILNQMWFFANIFSQFGAFVFILFTSWIFFFVFVFSLKRICDFFGDNFDRQVRVLSGKREDWDKIPPMEPRTRLGK